MYVVVTKTGTFTITKFAELKDLFASIGETSAEVFYTNGKLFKQVSA